MACSLSWSSDLDRRSSLREEMSGWAGVSASKMVSLMFKDDRILG